MSTFQEIMAHLEKLGSEDDARWMKKTRNTENQILGVRVPVLRNIAKQTGKDHALASLLWNSGIHEARILATMVEVEGKVTEEQAQLWVTSLDTWDLCDHFCGNLVVNTGLSDGLLRGWINRDEEFVKRAGFVLIAELALKGKGLADEVFIQYLEMIRKAEPDDRNFVKKAVNWALRQIGKRNIRLNGAALEAAEEFRESGNRTLKWIGSDALRELKSEAVKTRLEIS